MEINKIAHFPRSYYQGLTEEILSNICRCISPDGWSLEVETGWWVCGGCRKPSLYNAVRFCEGCEKPFVPLVNPGYPATDWGDSCSKCHRRPGYNVES